MRGLPLVLLAKGSVASLLLSYTLLHIISTSLTQKWHVPSRTRGIKSQPIKSIKIQIPVKKLQNLVRRIKAVAVLLNKTSLVDPSVKEKQWNVLDQSFIILFDRTYM